MSISSKPLEKNFKFPLKCQNCQPATFLLPEQCCSCVELTVVFILTFIVGQGGLKCLEENRFAKISPVLKNFLKTFVPDCFCF